MNIEFIQTIVCEVLGIRPSTIYQKHNGGSIKRNRPLVEARQWIRYFARKETLLSLDAIGLKTGHADHSTVIHSCNHIQDMIDTNRSFRELSNEIQRKLNSIAQTERDIEPEVMSLLNLEAEMAQG